MTFHFISVLTIYIHPFSAVTFIEIQIESLMNSDISGADTKRHNVITYKRQCQRYYRLDIELCLLDAADDVCVSVLLVVA